MAAWQWILSLAVIAFTAALIPALLQARKTLRAIEELTTRTGPKLGRALEEVTAVTARVNQLAATVERQAEAIQPLAEGLASLGGTLRKTRYLASTLGAIGAAVGPAVATGLAAFFGRQSRKPEPENEHEPREVADALASEPVPLRRIAKTGGD